MTHKSPDPIDVHVGNRLQQHRILLGRSQQAVGQAIGVSFQQIQKYERGINRLSASKLYRLAQLFNVSPLYFFMGLEHQTNIPEPFADPKVLRVTQLITQIHNSTQEQHLTHIMNGVLNLIDATLKQEKAT